ncbi:acetyl-CoA decarbonylase/synthase complex subunit gamma [candidate division KSB1 bacterium]|nr:acetyl-CoA decarbonylase/synthase complex subunit gamma [candidate division KSB1 bacterium]
MALTGLDIFKLLPKTNCGDCNVPTCLAFAMKLAQKKAELSECPHASEEAKQILGAAGEPPMRLIRAGIGADAVEIGGETEMFRHEKTFYHQTAIAIQVDDTLETEELVQKIKQADSFLIERVGEQLHIDAFCLAHLSGSSDRYLTALQTILQSTSKPIIIRSTDHATIREALNILDGKKAIVFCEEEKAGNLAEAVQKAGASLVVTADSLENLAGLTDTIAQTGFKDIFLHLTAKDLSQNLQNSVILRRSALRKNFKPFGYPLVTVVQGDHPETLLADAVVNICKYSGLLILPDFQKELLLTLFTLRQNIYTDPQKPIQVDAKLYPVGDPRPDSPVFVTTNFSLTYFIVSSEIENSGHSAWMVVPDCEGMSVLTAWAAGKFSGEKIAKFIQSIKVEENIQTREIIIPGYVASISGELEEKLPGWQVVVGPQEAADIASFMKNRLN